MGFKLSIANTVGVLVKGSTRNEHGEERAFAFTLFCDRLTNDELRAITKDSALTAQQFFQQHAKGWRGQDLVLDDANQPAPFSAESLEVLFSIGGMAALCFMAYQDQVTVTAKN